MYFILVEIHNAFLFFITLDNVISNGSNYDEFINNIYNINHDYF